MGQSWRVRTLPFWALRIARPLDCQHQLRTRGSCISPTTIVNTTVAALRQSSVVPNILAALLIFLIASALAGGIVAFISRTMGDSPIARIIKTVAPTLIMANRFFMILDELKIAEDIVVINYAAMIGAVALGTALAFGRTGAKWQAKCSQAHTNRVARRCRRHEQRCSEHLGWYNHSPTRPNASSALCLAATCTDFASSSWRL
jgi:hypothetical protein